MVKHYADVIDEDGYLKPARAMNFSSSEEIAAQVKAFIALTPNFNLLKELQLNEERKTGAIY